MILDVEKINRICWILLILSNTQAEEERTDLDVILNPLLRRIKVGIGTELQKRVNSPRNKKQLIKADKAAKSLPDTTNFPCDLKNTKLRSDKVPDTAHQVRPGDIDVIGAMGDSLTAGTGISALSFIQELFSEERGRSWSIGGEGTWRTYVTLPNILKEFNPNLFGYSLKGSQSFQYAAQFNVAENAAVSKNTPFMVKELVKRIKYDPRVDMKKHWKMVTIMIGDNDFCSEICYFSNIDNVLKNHRRDILFVLRYLRDNLPRTIVNVVPAPRLNLFFIFKNSPQMCKFIHSFVCPCISGLAFRSKRNLFSDLMIQWQQVDVDVSNMEEFNLEEFTVIPHNFSINYTFPDVGEDTLDLGYLAPDCFHFSERLQARVANNLWNSLLEPFGKKVADGTDTFSKFHCPSEEHPYIYTRRNSK